MEQMTEKVNVLRHRRQSALTLCCHVDS